MSCRTIPIGASLAKMTQESSSNFLETDQNEYLMEAINLLAISGSLRQGSYNSEALKALEALAPANVKINIVSIGDIPLFNPDRENEQIDSVEKLKATLGHSDGLIIASPEYAHGISGVLKNALDWLVSGSEFPYKPIMLVNTSPRASIALNALKEVLTTMSGVLVAESDITIPLLGSQLKRKDIVADKKLSHHLLKNMQIFITHIENNMGKN